MSPPFQTFQTFDVVGCGYVAEQHDETRQCEVLGSDDKPVDGTMAWLAFYAIALVTVVVTNGAMAPAIMLASAN